MGKRKGITIHIRDHDRENMDAEIAALRQRLTVLETEGNANMATMQEVQQELQSTVAQVQGMNSVVQGVQTVVATLVRQVEALEPLVGDPNALMEGINSIRTTANAFQGTLAAAVAMGTSAENDPAPQDGPVPMQVPNQAARDAGIRDQANVEAMQGAMPNAGPQQPAQRAEGMQAPDGGADLNGAPQPQQRSGEGVAAGNVRQAGTAEGGAVAQPMQQGQQGGGQNPPREGYNPDVSGMDNPTEGQPQPEGQPARAAQASDGRKG